MRFFRKFRPLFLLAFFGAVSYFVISNTYQSAYRAGHRDAFPHISRCEEDFRKYRSAAEQVNMLDRMTAWVADEVRKDAEKKLAACKARRK